MTSNLSSVTVTLSSATSGGTDKVVKVVTQDDVAKAIAQLESQDSNAVKDELANQFDSDTVAITEAYTVTASDPAASPAVGEEATSAKVTSETTYTLLGVAKSDLKAVYDDYLNTQLEGDDSQKIYDSGEDATQFTNFETVEGGYSIKATAVAQVGPNIDDAAVAEQSKGKRVGEVQQTIEAIQGVDSVKVSLSPFWVMTVPGDTSRITVSFKVEGNE